MRPQSPSSAAPLVPTNKRFAVNQKSLEELEGSLLELAAIYAAEPAVARECRDAVIRAKDRARFASRNPKVTAETSARKREMVEWMLVWLGDPAMFAEWCRLRKPLL